jgi:hypothetical protein
MTSIDDIDFDTYCGRIGNLYVRNGLSPPFGLYHAAQGWMARGIPLSHCVDVIEGYLKGYGRCYSSGSGDRDFAWLSELIETKWYDQSFARPPQPAAKQSRHHDWLEDEYGAVEQNQRPGRAAAFTAGPPNPAPKPDSFAPDGIALRQKTVGAVSLARYPPFAERISRQQGSASRLSAQALAPGPTKIATAVAWLRAELADGERVAAEVEAKARSVGVASRTFDRARDRLGVISRRIGFGRGAKYVMFLPVIHETPCEEANDAGAIS